MTEEIDARRPLEDILDKAVARAKAEGRLTLNGLLDLFGPRALGPLLVIFGLVAGVPPIGAIPLIPTTMGVLTFLFAAQFVAGRKRVWLPGLIGERSVGAGKLEATRRRLGGVASAVDRLLRPRLSALASPLLNRLVALVACVVALLMPPLEIVPFGVVVPGLALVCLGLGLIARDGLFTLIGLLVALVAAVFVLVVVPRAAQDAAEATEEVREEAAEAVGEAAEQAGEAASEAAETARERVGDAADGAREALTGEDAEASDEPDASEPEPDPQPDPQPEAPR